MITLPELAHYSTDFPDPAQALTEPNGLLAFGGDLSVERLENAYRRGIFPWFSANEPILWWSPDPRGVLPLDALYISKTTRKWLNKSQHSITINHAFDAVITACAAIPRGPIVHEDGSIVENGTWITQTMVNASHWVGLTFPGIIELPGSLAGREISPIPQRGPLANKRMLLAMCIRLTANLFKLPLISTIASCALNASNLFSAVTKGWPVSSEIF